MEINEKLDWLKQYADDVIDWVYSDLRAYRVKKDGKSIDIAYDMIWPHTYQEHDEFGFPIGAEMTKDISLEYFQKIVFASFRPNKKEV